MQAKASYVLEFAFVTTNVISLAFIFCLIRLSGPRDDQFTSRGTCLGLLRSWIDSKLPGRKVSGWLRASSGSRESNQRSRQVMPFIVAIWQISFETHLWFSLGIAVSLFIYAFEIRTDYELRFIFILSKIQSALIPPAYGLIYATYRLARPSLPLFADRRFPTRLHVLATLVVIFGAALSIVVGQGYTPFQDIYARYGYDFLLMTDTCYDYRGFSYHIGNASSLKVAMVDAQDTLDYRVCAYVIYPSPRILHANST